MRILLFGQTVTNSNQGLKCTPDSVDLTTTKARSIIRNAYRSSPTLPYLAWGHLKQNLVTYGRPSLRTPTFIPIRTASLPKSGVLGDTPPSKNMGNKIWTPSIHIGTLNTTKAHNMNSVFYKNLIEKIKSGWCPNGPSTPISL
ncbi:hypothetical protein [Flagellimonas lutimaris]|jgi:hypothetical protein|uniref:hypothetical protein n=1 Tax=Flagellimonas lutimaris TaxID=475082 RepID=UPI003F5CF12D